MTSFLSTKSRIAGVSSLAVLITVASIAGVAFLLPSRAEATLTGPSTLPSSVFVAAPPGGTKDPDDLTILSAKGIDGGKSMIWVAYQNGVQANGTAGKPGGLTYGTIAGYDVATGALVRIINVTGKIDGLTAWPAKHHAYRDRQ